MAGLKRGYDEALFEEQLELTSDGISGLGRGRI